MFAKRVERLTSSLIREILALAQKPEVISFAGGLPAAEAMPPLEIVDFPQSLRQYGTTEGEADLRARVAEHLAKTGLACKPEQILITTGSQQGIDLVSKLYVDEGTPVALEAPSYLAAIQSFRLFGARFIELDLHGEGIDPEQLGFLIARHRPAFVYLIPTFQNPSGVCYSEAIRAHVAQVLEATQTPLLEDEPYRELVFEPVDRAPLSARLEKATWITMGTFSKTGVPGLRVGYVAASEAVYAHLVRLKQCTDLHTNRIGQWWNEAFLAGPDYADHLSRLRDFYRSRRDAMQEALERHLRDVADWVKPHGGLFFWVRLKRECDTHAVLIKSLDRNVAFMPGEPFFANPLRRGTWMRLNFSHATPEQIDRGMAILGEVIRQHWTSSQAPIPRAR